MQPEPSKEVPGVDENQLASVTKTLLALPDILAEDADRFTQAIRALAETRVQSGWTNEYEENIAVFVMVKRPRQIGERFDTQPFTDLIATDEPLLGRLFLSDRNASRGRVMRIPVADPNAILEWLEDNGLASCPIVIVYKDSKKMVTRRNGIKDDVRIDPIRDRQPSATLEELCEALEHFHLTHLLTPSRCPDGVWDKGRAEEYVPGPQPEKSIQSDLRLALSFWFRGVVRVDIENTTNIGRIDVQLLVRDDQGGSFTYWAIIELKVIKSFSHPQSDSAPSEVRVSKNIESITKGIRQAWAYRDNYKADEGLLEIFDLRKKKNENLMEHAKVKDAIAECRPRPTCHVRPIFGSSSDARAAGFSGG